MWWLIIPVAVVVGGWIWGTKLVESNGPPLVPPSPTPSPQSLPTIIPKGFTNPVSLSRTLNPPSNAFLPRTLQATFKGNDLFIAPQNLVSQAGPIQAGTLMARIQITFPTGGTDGDLPVVWISPDEKQIAVQFGAISPLESLGIQANDVIIANRL